MLSPPDPLPTAGFPPRTHAAGDDSRRELQARLTEPGRLEALARSGLLGPGDEEAFDRLSAMAARLLHAPVAGLSLVAADRQFLKSAVGFAGRWQARGWMPLSHSFCQHLVASGMPLVLGDTRLDPRTRGSPAIPDDGALAYLGVPLRACGEVVGALFVLDRRPREWSSAELELLQDLAWFAVTAVERGGALREAHASRLAERRQAALNDAAHILARADTLEAAAVEILRSLCRRMRWGAGIFWSVDEDAGVLVCTHASSCGHDEGPLERLCRRVVLFPGSGLAGRVWQSRRVEWIADVALEPPNPTRDAAVAEGVRGAVALPLMAEGTVVGVLEFVTRERFAADAELVEAMSALAAQIQTFVSRRRVEVNARRLAAIVDDSDVAFVATTPGGVVTDWNRGAEEIFGYTASEACGRSGLLLVPKTERVDPPPDPATLPAHYEAERLRKDGRRIWVSVTRSLVHDQAGELAAVSYVARDVTGQRALRERLRQSEAETRTILAALPDVVLVLSQDGRYEKVATTATESMNAPPQELVGRFIHEVLPAAAADRLLAEIREVVRTGATRRVEYTLAIRGREAHFDATVKPVAPGRVLWVARDVTERVRSEQQLREKEEELRQSQKIEAIGRLAGGIAHDFNNLLTVIAGNVQLLLLDTPPGSPTRADLEETQRAVDRAAALTRQLLAFSRKQVMRPQPVALEALVGGVDTLLRRVIGEDVELVTDVPPGTWPVRVDPGQMEQVLVNLAVNARDAMPRGGKLSITARNGPAGGSPRRGCARRFAARDHVLLSVADTGTGMDEATLARVFEPFFTTRPEGQGTGLGMSTVYGIVRQSDGEICVESSPGRGTAVHVSLPRCDPAEGDERPAAEPAAVVVVGGETILLVEDEPGVRAVVSRLLRRSGYSLLEAASGEEAVELMDGDRLAGVDLVITDVVMPGLTGPELAARLRLARPRLKILYMSGYTDAALQSHGALAPGVDLIEKPFSLEVLAARVRLLLDAA